MKAYFDHEKLDADKKESLAFAAWSEAILEHRTNSPDRLHEEAVEYRLSGDAPDKE